MRIWHCDPAYLDMQRLVAQHREIHMFLTCVKRGREWGPTREFKTACQYASYIHDAVLAEMHIRSGSDTPKEHFTPFDYSDLSPEHCSYDFTPSPEHLRIDATQLRQKWELEGYFNGMGRLCLTTLEKELGLPEGLTLPDGTKKKVVTRFLVKANKTWFDQYRKGKPKSRMQDRYQAFLKTATPEETKDAKPSSPS